MSVNGVIAAQTNDCVHGKVGDKEQMGRGAVSKVVDVDRKNGVVTFDAE